MSTTLISPRQLGTGVLNSSTVLFGDGVFRTIGETPVATAAFTNLRLGVANVRAGNSDTKIAFIGDSTTSGVGGSTAGTIPSLKSYPSCLGKLLNSFKVSTADGMGVPPSILSGSPDARWTAGSGWTQTTFGSGGGACWQSGTATTNLTYQETRVAWDRCTIYYLTNSGLGYMAAAVTGGAGVIQPTSGTAGVSSVTLSAGSASTSNVLTISGTEIFIVGVEPWRSTVPTVRIANFGVGSSESSNWIASGPFESLTLLTAYAPALTVISLGIIDAGNSVPLATYLSNMSSLITSLQAIGDVMVSTMPPSYNDPAKTFEESYVPALVSLCASLNCPVLDLYGRFGSAFDTGYMNDNYHPNDAGYQDWSAGVFNVLATVI